MQLKKAFLLILVATLCLSLSGCDSFLEEDYLIAEKYVDDLPVIEGSSVLIGSYQSLKNAIIALVDAHQESETLIFSGYNGDVAKDLPRVCSELKAENALCAYAVDYISYDLSRIVSYYEAQISINFQRSKEQMAQLRSIGSVTNAEAEIHKALKSTAPTLTLSAVGQALNLTEVQEMAQKYYYEAPLQWLQQPRVSMSVYPNVGISRIYEFSFNYGGDAEELEHMLAQLHDTAESFVEDIAGEDALCASLAASRLSETCTWTRENVSYEPTAYGALVNGRATSEGFALAYKALCELMGLDCLVISGRMDKTPHVWNMVKLGDDYYHVDVSQLKAGEDNAVLFSDSEMLGRYWWDIELYPDSSTEAIGQRPVEEALPVQTTEEQAIPQPAVESDTEVISA